MKRKDFFKKLFSIGSVALFGVYGYNITNEKEDLSIEKSLKLITTNVAGMQYYEGKSHIKEIKPGDKVKLRREPLNHYDARAIAIYWQNVKLGYVPRHNNAAITAIMDSKIEVRAQIAHINPEQSDWHKIYIRIFMNNAQV